MAEFVEATCYEGRLNEQIASIKKQNNLLQAVISTLITELLYFYNNKVTDKSQIVSKSETVFVFCVRNYFSYHSELGCLAV